MSSLVLQWKIVRTARLNLRNAVKELIEVERNFGDMVRAGLDSDWNVGEERFVTVGDEAIRMLRTSKGTVIVSSEPVNLIVKG